MMSSLLQSWCSVSTHKKVKKIAIVFNLRFEVVVIVILDT